MSDQQLEQQLKASRIVFEFETMERSMIAGQLHENLAQTLSAMKMNLSALESNIPKEQFDHRTVLASLIELVDTSCNELRMLSHRLMPQSLLRKGLVPALQEYLYQVEQRGVHISFYAEDLSGIAEILAISLYKVLQEIVENAVKHSGANRLDIALIKEPDGIAATIEDNGIGFEQKSNSIKEGGLKSISSRIEFLNGTVEWNSSKEKGNLVAIYIPNH